MAPEARVRSGWIYPKRSITVEEDNSKVTVSLLKPAQEALDQKGQMEELARVAPINARILRVDQIE